MKLILLGPKVYFFATVALLSGQIGYSLLFTHSCPFGQLDVSDAQTGAVLRLFLSHGISRTVTSLPALSHAGHMTPVLWDSLEGFVYRWMKLEPCCTVFMFHEQSLVYGPGREHSGSRRFSSSVTVAEF